MESFPSLQVSYASGPKSIKPAIRPAWKGNKKVDEESFLNMQQDYLRLKKAEKATEEKMRQLAAQLARTEEAAKRAMVRNDSSARGGAAQRLLDLERELTRLGADKAEAEGRAAREHKRAVDYKVKAEELKRRLEGVLKDQRRLVQQVGQQQSRMAMRPSTRGDMDKDHSGALDRAELSRLIARLLPDSPPADVKFFVSMLDADGDGRVTLDELVAAIRESLAAGGAVAERRERETAEALQELRLYLSQHALEAVAHFNACDSQKTGRLGWSEATLHDVRDGWIDNDSAAAHGIDSQLQVAWEKANMLKKRYLETKSALDAMKSQNATVLKELEDKNMALHEQRMLHLKVDRENNSLRMELERFRELQPMLDGERKERVRLEKENNGLLSKAFSAPGAAMNELRTIKAELYTVKREKAAAELREAEARRELADLMRKGGLVAGGAPSRAEDTRVVQRELSEAQRELARTRIELESANAKLDIFRSTGVLDGMEGKRTHMAGAMYTNNAPDAEKAEDEIRRELAALREVYSSERGEGEKLRKLLQYEEEKRADLEALLELAHRQKEDDAKALQEKVGRLERERDRLEEQVGKLEVQLRGAYTGRTGPKALRASQPMPDAKSGAALHASLASDINEELAPNENIFEVHISGAVLEAEAVGGAEAATFVALDFFEHETQATPVVGTLRPEYDTTVQYVVEMDSFFLEYMDTKFLTLELNRSKGWDYEALGVARVALRQLLDHTELGLAGPANRKYQYADVHSAGGRYIGKVRYAVSVLRPMEMAIRAYRRTWQPADNALARGQDCAAAAVAQAQAHPESASHIQVTVLGCRNLQSAVGMSTQRPYVSYTLPGYQQPYDTSFGQGAHPDFADASSFAIARSPELERELRSRELQVTVFDDAESGSSDRSIVGIAHVPLRALAEGLPVQGTFPVLQPSSRQPCGEVTLTVRWHNPMEPNKVPRPPSSPAVGHRAQAASPAPSAQHAHQQQARQGQAQPAPRQFQYDEDEPETLYSQSTSRRPSEHGTELQSEASELREMSYTSGGVGGRGAGAAATPDRGTPHKRMQNSSLDGYGEDEEDFGLGAELGYSPAPKAMLPNNVRPLSGKGRARYDTSAELSIEELPGRIWQPISMDELEWPDRANHLMIIIESVQLKSEVLRNRAVESVFVMYNFLPHLCQPEEQCTHSLPVAAKPLIFNAGKAYALHASSAQHAAARSEVAQLMKAAEGALIPVCIVSQREGAKDYQQFGFADINLQEVVRQRRDLRHHQLTLLAANNHPVATLTLSVIAVQVLQNLGFK
ncbi:hypothetical protein WJX72_006558 [[Myrmecia] bisecta]|uniref:C2 domain-containing protein n=1 Tax=[Myrmecia] bisecta TaxID=41462 RepID=A0AAW1PNX6_9CHLO